VPDNKHAERVIRLGEKLAEGLKICRLLIQILELPVGVPIKQEL
jgi:hypothetical protein